MELPGFELIAEIGSGGMGTVWKARQISLDRVVAIKMLPARAARDPADAKRFQAEAMSAAKLRHSGIVQVYDANVHEGIYYFVMEYVAGYSVGDWIRRKKKLTEEEALLVAHHVAEAFDYAWKNQRIIHCDIKPDNVMVDSDGTVKVADLGLARSIGDRRAWGCEEEVMGTPNYMSPEQVRGASNLDCRTDIYSLGAMLYQMVTGQMLFHDSNDDDVMEKQIGGTVDDPLDCNPSLSMGMCWLIEKMLAKNRDDRHSDWDAVLADIKMVQRGDMPLGPPLAEGSSTVRRSASRTRATRHHRLPSLEEDKRKISPAIAVAVVLSLVLGVFLVLWLHPGRDAGKPAPLQQRRPPGTVTKPPRAGSLPIRRSTMRRSKSSSEWRNKLPGPSIDRRPGQGSRSYRVQRLWPWKRPSVT